jgi:hypothetical protein
MLAKLTYTKSDVDETKYSKWGKKKRKSCR